MIGRMAFTAALVILALAAPPGVFAQARPDLSGTWLLNYDKSGPEVAGNGADVPFPSQLVVTQSPMELSVKRSSVEAPAGITETGEAKFDGATLVITSHRSFSSPAGDTVVEFKEVWSIS